MTITDAPKPGAAPIGTRFLWVIGRKGSDLSVMAIYGANHKNAARTWARSEAVKYDEVHVVDGVVDYHVWADGKPDPAAA